MKRLRLAVGADGNGSCFQAVLNGTLVHDTFEVSVAYTNIPGCYAMERARLNGIPIVELDPKKFSKRREHEVELEKMLSDHEFDAIVMLGDERVKTAEFIDGYSKRGIHILNTHPAPAPQFRGLNGYAWALGEHKEAVQRNAWTCVTFHTIEAEIDRGMIIAQCPVPVYKSDKVDDLKKRGLQIEHFQIVQCLDYLARGLVRFDCEIKTADVIYESNRSSISREFAVIGKLLECDISQPFTVQVDTRARRWDLVKGFRTVEEPRFGYDYMPTNLAFTYAYRAVKSLRQAGLQLDFIFNGVNIHPVIMKSDHDRGLKAY